MTPEHVDGRPHWSTPVGALAAVLVGGVALLAAALFVDNEPAGRLLVGLAGAGMLIIAALGFLQRPRLAIVAGNPARLAVKRLRSTSIYGPADIDRARVVRYPRLGRRVPMLELEFRRLDGDTRLTVYGRWDLGADPHDVLESLADHGLAPRE